MGGGGRYCLRAVSLAHSIVKVDGCLSAWHAAPNNVVLCAVSRAPSSRPLRSIGLAVVLLSPLDIGTCCTTWPPLPGVTKAFPPDYTASRGRVYS